MEHTREAMRNADDRRERFPVVWSEAQRVAYQTMAAGGSGGYSAVDPLLAEPLLRCADGAIDDAERTIVRLLGDHLDACQTDEQVFISFLNAAFVVQRMDIVAGLLKDRFGFARALEIVASREGPGIGRVRWDVLASGHHRFVFDARSVGSDRARYEILAFQWGFPLYANYAKQDGRVSGSVVINQQDVGETPGLAWCDNRPDYFLVPDCIFVPTRGYAWARQVFGENAVAWHDRLPVAFWRGATTGIPTKPNDWRSLERVRLCELARRHSASGLIDAALSSVIQFDDAQTVAQIHQSGLMGNPVPWEQWNRYKFLIDIDGNSSPWSNLFQRLLTGSTVLKVESMRGLQQWYYDKLRPWDNYVPIAPDMSDLIEKVGWLVHNDPVAQRIGASGRALAETLTYEREVARSASVIESAFRYFNDQMVSVGPFGRCLEINDGHETKTATGPNRVRIFGTHVGKGDLVFANVAEEDWAFYMFDGHSCQLHPADWHEAPAQVSVHVDLNGQTRFDTEIAAVNPLGHPVEFRVTISAASDGGKVAEARQTVLAGEHRRFSVQLPSALKGLYRVTFGTVMAELSATNHQARANWIAPAFTP